MKRAKILHDGRAQWGEVIEHDTLIRLRDGICIAAEHARWLPPITPGATIFALGLNYADHSAELGFKAPTSPLVFLKGHGTLIGHAAATPRRADADQMHPECELVAVIGRPARSVTAAAAMAYVSGYTIACDYAIREYLENYYRPNLRVKNLDATTPLGPWIVDAEDIANPQSLRLRTTVNGTTVQEGSTAQMVFSIATLVEHLSSFMTLLPGDLILTGTPHGVSFVAPGDEVVCEIEGIGRLTNRLVQQVKA